MALSLTKLNEVKKRGALNVNGVSFIDKSGSMTWGSEKNDRGTSRWDISIKVNTEITKAVCEFDDDGIDLVFFNDGYKVVTGVTEDKVRSIFASQTPGSGTSLAAPLREMVNKYLPAKIKTPAQSGGFMRKESLAVYETISPEKPVAFLIWTDGSPSDRDAVEQVIIDASRRINKDSDFGIAIIQIGHDQGAKSWLKTLDKGLVAKGAAFDVVAVVHFDEILAAKLSPEDIIRVAFTG
ncbi:MAG: hypothetical protein Q8T09_11450 [Candidatus Melainabacteria bacterium]|nr:hypothetical protein [Candidatus Melainabacteria bacterium]